MESESNNFLRALIRAHLDTGVHDRVATRFPPEPNGYLHIGHAKSICLNFGLAREFGGTCNLRFDDTNPAKEEVEYVESIKADVQWLGFQWSGLYFASDYFERMYLLAEALIEAGKAYVDDLDEAEIRAHRGTISEPGRPSPYRDRSIAENLDLLRRMRAGEFPNGARVLRAKGDMSAANLKLRDPLLYRIRHDHHHRTGDAWCIYPMYDYAHPLSDAFEGITHSICTLEFENNRDIYDWVIRETGVHEVHQYEFARLFLTYTVMSKRKLLRLVKEGFVSGWDDPRMPTIAALRRRGVTADAIRDFADRVGVAKANSVVEIEVLEGAIRDDLNTRAPRWMAVLDPVELVVESWTGGPDAIEAAHWPHDVAAAEPTSRLVNFGRRLWIDRSDFAVEAPPKWHRLAPGREVRLRYGYVVRCVGFETDDAGNVVRVRCTHDPETRGGNLPAGRKVAGTIQWVNADDAVSIEARLYDRLFAHERPDGDDDFTVHLNPHSLSVVTARAEPGLAALPVGTHVQLERVGYFFVDPVDSRPGAPVLNRTVGLKDSWVKQDKPKVEAPRPIKVPEPRAVKEVRRPADALTTDQAVRAERWIVVLGLSEDDAALLSADDTLAEAYDTAVDAVGQPLAVARFFLNDLPKDARASVRDPAAIGRLVVRIEDGTITSRAGKDVLAVLLAEGGDPDAIIAARGLRQTTDTSGVTAFIAKLLAKNPDKVAAYRGGRTGLFGFFVGEVMKATRGTVNATVVNDLVKAALA